MSLLLSTVQRDAFSLLFEDDFEGKPLFRNQVDLVTELINHPQSDYHVAKENKDEYPKAISRMKAFVSQLFSEHCKRSVSLEFKRSLEVILKEKSQRQPFDVDAILRQVVTDLKEKNTARKYIYQSAKKESDNYADLACDILDATVITIFTARPIHIELKLMDQKMSLYSLLIEDLIASLRNEQSIKKYHFNFPMEQTCILFWKGFRKELSNFITLHSHLIPYIQRLLNPAIGLTDCVASNLLQYLSNERIINVYHLQAPVYITSVISLEQNGQKSSAYLCLKTDEGQDQLHKLSGQEMFLSTFFVWNNLKMTHPGSPMRY